MAKGLFKIYVGNLDYKVTEFAVRRLFEAYGDIEDIAMATDKETGKPRGFAIVMMRDHDEAQTAISGVQGRRLMGRALVVNEAIKKKGSEKGEKVGEPAASGANAGSGARTQYRSRVSADGRESREPRSSSSGRNPRRGGRNPRRGTR